MKTETMEKAIITDYNIVENDRGRQTILKNNQVRFDFSDCYFIVEQDKYKPSGLRINKIAKKASNSDQIVIEPNCTNSVAMF